MIDPKEVDESLEESKMIDEMPEAPLSIHIDTYYKGFHSGITIRMPDNKLIPISKIKTVIDNLVSQGFKPSWNEDTNKVQEAPKDLGRCPDCDAPMKMSSKGKPYCSKLCWKK